MINIVVAFFAMMAIVAASNFLVQFPINDWLTWGALPYPLSFFLTELTNKQYGAKVARKIVFAGFGAAIFCSLLIASPKIACGSATAFLVAQLLDIAVFNRFRQASWWQAPLFASAAASLIDTIIFWTIAFWGENLPVITWALGDFSIKLLLDAALLSPFRFLLTTPKNRGTYTTRGLKL